MRAKLVTLDGCSKWIGEPLSGEYIVIPYRHPIRGRFKDLDEPIQPMIGHRRYRRYDQGWDEDGPFSIWREEP